MEESVEYDPLALVLGTLEPAHGMVPSGMAVQGSSVISLALSFLPSLEAPFKLSDFSSAAPKMVE